MKIKEYILLILLILLQSCSFEKKHNTELIFWGMGAEGEILKHLLKEFEKENPSINVRVQQVPWSAAQEKLITAYASNMLPDLFQLGNTWVPQFKALNALEELDNFVDSSSIINPQNYFKGIWETNIIDSAAYGIPWYVDTRVLYYRTDIFKQINSEPPKTWTDLYNVSKRIKILLNDEGKYPLLIPTNDWTPYVIFAMQNGASILKQNNCYGNFSSSEFKEAFNYLINFYKEKLSPVGISNVTNVYQAFRDGYITMYISGPWNVKEFQKWMTDSLQHCWSTAPLPSNNNRYPGISLAGGSSLVINKKSSKKNAAWKIIEYLSKRKTQIEFYNLVNDLPAVKSAWNDSTFSNNRYVKAFYEQLKNVKATPKIPEWEQIVSAKLQQYVEYVANNKMATDEALNALDKDVNRILEKRRWMLRVK